MNNKLLIILLLLLVSPVMANIDTISIYGTNASNAKTNLTQTGNQSVNIVSWSAGGIKSFYVNVTNASDILTLNIYNNTANQIDEILIGGRSINGLKTDGTGLMTFTQVQPKSNVTWTVRPALQAGGYNWSWGWFENLWVVNQTIINNVTITNITTLNATNVQGNGSGLYGLNISNITGATTTILGGGGIIVTTNSANNYTISGDPFLSKWDSRSLGGGLNNNTQGVWFAGGWVLDSVAGAWNVNTYYENVQTGLAMINYTLYSPDSLPKTIHLLGASGNRGRFSVYLNGKNQSGIMDFYSTSANPNTEVNMSIVPDTGYNLVTLMITTKNAASSSSSVELQAAWITNP